HPTGCVDVDSEWAAVDEGDAQVDQRQQWGRQLAGLRDRSRELLGGLEDRRAVRVDLRRVEQVAEGLALLGEHVLQGGIAAVVLDLLHSWHRASPLPPGPRWSKYSGSVSAKSARSPPSSGRGTMRPAAARTAAGACGIATPSPATRIISRSFS